MKEKHANVNWQAHWIWQPSAEISGGYQRWTESQRPDSPNTYVYFRREFEQSTVPDHCPLRVSADTSYRLFINGSLVGWGPVMTEPRWQTYDTYEAAPFLKPGVNVIGAIVYHFGNGPDNPIRNTFHPSRGGFLCQLDFPTASPPLLTDASWQCLQSKAWKKEVPKMDRMTYAEVVDARHQPVGWLEPCYDSDNWSLAQIVTLHPSVAQWSWNPLPSDVFPWLQLAPRPLPYFVVERLPAPQILATGEVLERTESYHSDDLAARMSLELPKPSNHTRIDNAENILDDAGEATPAMIHPISDEFSYDDWPGMHAATITIDAGSLINGRVTLDLTAEAGTVIDIGYAQILVDDRVIPYLSHRTMMADEFIAREGRQTLQTYNWRNFRYVLLTFRHHQNPVALHQVRVESERYPFEETGAFACSDEMLNWTWQACIKTAELCTYDRLMDNPIRERRQYTLDILCNLDAYYAAFGNPRIVDKYFTDILHSQFAYGMFPNTVLGNSVEEFNVLVDGQFELFFRVWQHYELLADRSMLERFYHPLQKVMELFQQYTDDHGLLGALPFTMFIDWADVDRTGTSLTINLLHADAWRVLALIAGELGDDGKVEGYREHHQRLCDTINQLYWDAGQGAFCDTIIDGKRSAHISEHANFLAMLLGIASDDQCQAIAKRLASPEVDDGQVEPCFIWCVEGLFARGFSQWVLDLIRQRYGRFRRQGLDTIAELWSMLGERYTGRWRARDSRSAVQAGGVSAAYMLSRYVLGIHPAKPGFAEVHIAPACGDIGWARGSWPSPKGPIKVDWKIDADERLHLECQLPGEMGGTVQVPEPFLKTAQVTINGERVAVSQEGYARFGNGTKGND